MDYNEYRQRRKSRSKQSLRVGILATILVFAVGFFVVRQQLASQADAKLKKDNDELIANSEKMTKEGQKFLDAAESQLNSAEVFNALAADTGMRNHNLKKIGFIKRFDYEAKNVVVDHAMWQTMSTIEGGRMLAATAISNEIKYKTSPGSPEVTLFSSETGQSLAWVDERHKTHIFR